MRLTSSGRKVTPNGLGYNSDLVCQKPTLFWVLPASGWAIHNALDLDSEIGRPEIVWRFHSPNGSTLHTELSLQILNRRCQKIDQ